MQAFWPVDAASLRGGTKPARVELRSAATLPTTAGNFDIHVFAVDGSDKEHAALVHGDVFGAEGVTTRLHSECLTGDVFGSLRCDCGPQLERSMQEVASAPRGIILYLRQEGRGIGLANKIRAYKLQEEGLDTVEANRALGFADDERDYGIAAAMLRLLGVRSVDLMTNNPDKVAQLERYGVRVASRVSHVVEVTSHARAYLETKARKCGHHIDVDRLAVAAERTT